MVARQRRILESNRSISRYNHTSVTSRLNAPYHSMIFGAPLATPRSIASKSSVRSEEHTSELQSLMRISYAVFCLKTKICDFLPALRLHTHLYALRTIHSHILHTNPTPHIP